ncbi:MAG: hypothetical protein ACTHMI_22415 [Mucilaginibacter sp.]
MRKLFGIGTFLILISAIACNAGKGNKPVNTGSDTVTQNKRKWLKQYALCSCIKYSFKSDTAIANDLSFSIYREISDYGYLAVYSGIDSLAKHAALAIKPSPIADYNHKKALLNGCINFYESTQLDSVVKALDTAILRQ